ncbi:MAG: chromate resistance protein ChrB [Desulfomonile sp.]|nr:chromate resistance protein ChrB [Desulfomonile sp.]
MKWLFFSYTLPSRPSRARVHTWRQLKKLGAVSYQSMWVLPYSTERLTELRKLTGDIEGWKGEALLIEGKLLDSVQEERIRKAFAASRDEEYQEIIRKCEDYAKEIQFEIDRQNFIFAEVEENEEDLEKLKHWLRNIEKRDLVKAPLHKQAVEKVSACETLFEDFAQRVYEHTQIQERRRIRGPTQNQPDGRED